MDHLYNRVIRNIVNTLCQIEQIGLFNFFKVNVGLVILFDILVLMLCLSDF